jgi:hypothetical protein
VVDAGGQPHLCERIERSAATLAPRDTGVDERQLDVPERGRPRQQVVRLEDEPDLRAADVCAPRLVERRHLLAVELVRARCRAVEAAEDAEQRRLARAGTPHDRDELAVADDEVDRPQRLDGELAAAVDLSDPGQLDDGGVRTH